MQRLRPLTVMLVASSCCLLWTGCIDAAKDGVTGGITDGIEDVISGVIEEALEDLIDP